MHDFYRFLLISIGSPVVLGLIAYIGFRKAQTANTKKNWLFIPAVILAIVALFTSWMWFFYTNYFVALPSFLVSGTLLFIARKQFASSTWSKWVFGMLSLSVLLAIISAFAYAYVRF